MSTRTPVGVEVELSVDELRLVRDHFPGLTLPGFIEPAPVDAGERALFDELRDRGVLDVSARLDDPTWVAAAADPLVVAFSMLAAADLVIQSRGWDGVGSVEQLSVVSDVAAAHIVRRGTGTAADRVAVSVTALDALWSVVTGGIPEYDVERPLRGAATIGLAASQALVSAWQQPDRRIMQAVASDFRIDANAVELFRALAEPARRGFRLKVLTAAGGVVLAANWIGTANGWLRMSVGAHGATMSTAQDVVDAGTVTAIAERPDQVQNDLLGIVAGLVRDRVTHDLGRQETTGGAVSS